MNQFFVIRQRDIDTHTHTEIMNGINSLDNLTKTLYWLYIEYNVFLEENFNPHYHFIKIQAESTNAIKSIITEVKCKLVRKGTPNYQHILILFTPQPC